MAIRLGRGVLALAAMSFLLTMAQAAEPDADLAAGAAKQPPPIGDIVGDFALKVSVTLYDMTTGAPVKQSMVKTWTITAVDSTNVTVTAGTAIGTLNGKYMNGVLALVSPSSGIVQFTGVVVFSGAAPKIKATGSFTVYNGCQPAVGKGTVSGNKVP